MVGVRRASWGGWVACILTAALALHGCGPAQESGDWIKATSASTKAFSGVSVHEARERALREHRLLVIDTTASWCAPCRQMEKTTWQDPRVIDWIAANAIAVQVDVDRLREVSEALEIRAMPTIVLFRDGVEIDRSTGLQPPTGLLAWLEWARQQRPGAGTTPLDLSVERVPYEAVPDVGGDLPLLRGMQADADMAAGRLDRALSNIEWLWVHGAEKSPSYSGVRLSFLVSTMQKLAGRHEPARDSFGRFLDSAQAEVDAGHVSFEVWRDWLGLCKVSGAESRIDGWYEAHRDPDGSIDAGRYCKAGWIAESLFEHLARAGRYADAGRLYRWPTACLEEAIAFDQMIAEASADGASGAAIRVIEALGRDDDRLRRKASTLSAALIAADRLDEAREVARLLLGRLDDGESRKALVRWALDWARPLPDHVRWYAEAAEMGADVESMEPALEAAVHH